MRALLRRLARDDRGFSSAAFIILSMPVIVGMFGLGLDATRLAYISNHVQGKADLAVQSASTLLYATGGVVRLGDPISGSVAASEKARNLYWANTNSARGNASTGIGYLRPVALGNGNPAILITGTPPTTAQLCSAPGSNPYRLEMQVTEKVPPTFLKLLGVGDFTLTFKSTALVRGRNC